MESAPPPVITPEQRKDFAGVDEKLDSSRASSVTQDVNGTEKDGTEADEKTKISRSASIAEDPQTTKDETSTNQAERVTTNDEEVYLTGFKLLIVLASLTLVFFLVLLDMSIISTVRMI